MNDEERRSAEAAKPIVTTQEHALADPQTGEWRMPEPVYQQTSGHLPRGFEKQFPQHEDTPTAPMPSQRQPDIIEQLASAPPIEPVPAPGNYPSRLSIAIGILLLLALIAAAALFALYYYFFMRAAESGF